MRAIFLSLMVIALVGTLAGGGLFAYFSDTETSVGNSFQAGTIHITLDGDVGKAVHGTLVKDWKPCQTGYLVFDVTNDGANAADVWKLIDDVVCTGGWEETSAERRERELNGEDNDIAKAVHFGMWLEDYYGNDDALPDSDYHFFNAGIDKMLLEESAGKFVSDVAGQYMYLGELAVGETIHVVQTFHMDKDTTNWAQGDDMTWNEDYFAQQVDGPVAPQPELPLCSKP